jgi:high-affinity nickel-transport protein
MIHAPLHPPALWAIVFSVFVLGLRHGADPDHLAAIDNLTRNSLSVRSRLSRFVGAIFAGGHSVMVLSIAALAGLFGSHIAVHRDVLETAGTWVSIATLFGIGALNVRQLTSGAGSPLRGVKYLALPRALRVATSPLAALPVGLLFGLGFDTSSQIAAYSLALATAGGWLVGLGIGLVFSCGMAVTDTLDSLLVYRLCTRHPLERVRTTRIWILAVTVLAFVVGGYELAQVLGWRSPLPDLAVSGLLVASLLAVFAWTFRLAASTAPQDELGTAGAAVSSTCPSDALPSHSPAPATFSGAVHSRTDGGPIMKGNPMRIAGGITLAIVAGAMLLYAAHPVRGSDHQDSPTTVNRPAADITDVFAYQAPDNPNNVVLQMDVWPLITHSQLGMVALDPAVMYQFKIDNTGDGVEDLVIQLQPNTAGPGQSINVYGPGKPNETGTNSSFIQQTGSVAFNDRSGTPLSNGMKVFVGPTKDPFFFDLLTFFNIIPDRYYGCHAPFTNAFGVPCGAATASSFNGFTSAFNQQHSTSCSLTPASDTLSSHQFNVIAIVVELPKSLLLNPAHPVMGVWATTSTTSGS